MAFTREECLNDIIHMISVLYIEIKAKNQLKLQNANIIAEDFYAELLNLIFDWNLVNANIKNPNAEGIDLIDEDNRIVVQVSATKTGQKINHSIDEFIAKNNIFQEISKKSDYQQHKFHFIMLIITEKQDSYRFEDKSQGLIDFDKEKDIWDYIDILKEISKLSTGKLIEIAKYLHEELDGYDHGSKESNIADILENLYLRRIAEITYNSFGSKFSEMRPHLDDEIDGVIGWQEKGKIIDCIYVQCFGGNSYFPDKQSMKEKFKVQKLDSNYIENHYPVWKSKASPTIIVICNDSGKVWWADLKNEETYNEDHTEIWIKPENVYNRTSYHKIKKIVRRQMYVTGKAGIKIKGEMLEGCLGEKTLKELAKDYYRSFTELPSANSELDKKIIFSRVGWRHFTREGRRKSRVVQSLLLLPLIPDIIAEAKDYDVLNYESVTNENYETIITQKLGIKAEVEFNYRFPTIVQIILLRKKIISGGNVQEKTWFYSIYELSRNQTLGDVTINY